MSLKLVYAPQTLHCTPHARMNDVMFVAFHIDLISFALGVVAGGYLTYRLLAGLGNGIACAPPCPAPLALMPPAAAVSAPFPRKLRSRSVNTQSQVSYTITLQRSAPRMTPLPEYRHGCFLNLDIQEHLE